MFVIYFSLTIFFFLTSDERAKYPVESESEYLESDESIGESSTSEDYSQDNMPGPPKPPRLYRDPTPTAPLPPPPPPQAPFEKTQSSPPSKLHCTVKGGLLVLVTINNETSS